MCTTLFSILTARNLYTPLTKVSKQLLQLPGNAKNNILTHPGILGFITLEQNQLIHHFTEFVIRINENSLATTTMLIRLRNFQLKHGITNPIWTLNHSQLSILSVHNNLSASILKRMRQLDFAFEFNGDIHSWSIPGSSQDLFHLFLPLDNSKKLFRSFWTCSTPVFRIEQCLDQQSNNILPWPLIKSALRRSKKGRPPHWYNWLKLHYTPTISIDHIITRRLWIPTTNFPTFDKRKKE